MPRIKPDDFLDDDNYNDDQEFVIDDDTPSNRRGQVIVPKNPERREYSWEESRKRLQRKFRSDYD